MKSIMVYDEDDQRIQALGDKYDLMESEIIQILLDNIEGEEDEIFEWRWK